MLLGAGVVAPADIERAFDFKAHDVVKRIQVLPVVDAQPVTERGREGPVEISLISHGRPVEDDCGGVPLGRSVGVHGGMVSRYEGRC